MDGIELGLLDIDGCMLITFDGFDDGQPEGTLLLVSVGCNEGDDVVHCGQSTLIR